MVILISKIDTRKFHGQNRKMTFTSKKMEYIEFNDANSILPSLLLDLCH